MQNAKLHNITLHSAFMMEGLHEAGYDACIKAWDQGCIEMVSAMVAYVPYVNSLIAISEAIDPDNFPGVFDYEVSSPFGKWFGNHILEKGDVPAEADAKEWLRNEVLKFFTQGLDKEKSETLERAFQDSTKPASAPSDSVAVARWDAYNEGKPAKMTMKSLSQISANRMGSSTSM